MTPNNRERSNMFKKIPTKVPTKAIIITNIIIIIITTTTTRDTRTTTIITNNIINPNTKSNMPDINNLTTTVPNLRKALIMMTINLCLISPEPQITQAPNPS